jgi:hypothetical protein
MAARARTAWPGPIPGAHRPGDAGGDASPKVAVGFAGGLISFADATAIEAAFAWVAATKAADCGCGARAMVSRSLKS